jgi:hypothetical protein
MDDYSLAVYDRETGNLLPLLYTPVVETMVWGEGGSQSASTRVSGIADDDLYELLSLLRCPVKIFDRASSIWRGYIHSVQITTSQGYKLTASLENMANKIRVKYTVADSSLPSYQQAIWSFWESNDDSISIYGTKEAQFQVAEAFASQVTAFRGRALAEYAWPLTSRDISGVGKRGAASGVITMRGWFETLSWTMFSEALGKESYETGDSTLKNQAVFDVGPRRGVAQSFQLSSANAWGVTSAALKIKKVESPTSNLYAEIQTDNAGVPSNVVVASSNQIVGSTLTDQYDWVTFTFPSEMLALSTTYWLVLRATSYDDPVNYYRVEVNEALGYTGGAMKVFNIASWADRSPDADVLFAIYGGIETTQQIANIITSCGQFLNGSFIETVSGVWTSTYREGERDGLTCIRELLRSGSSTDKRLTAEVLDNLTVLLSQEPVQGAADYKIMPDGTYRDAYDGLITIPPAGVWLNTTALLSPVANLSMIANPASVFIEGVTWNKGKISLKLRGMGFEAT